MENTLTKWEDLRINVSYRESGLIDSVTNRLSQILSDALPHELDDYLNKLGEEGWELVSGNVWSDGYDEACDFTRPGERRSVL